MTRYDLSNEGGQYSVDVTESGRVLRIVVGERAFSVQVHPNEVGSYTVTIDGKPVEVSVEEISPQSVRVRLGGETLTFHRGLEKPMPHAALGDRSRHGDAVVAPMPGRIITIAAKRGQSLKEGDTVAVIESMKMESTIGSPCEAVVSEVLVTEGASVKRGQPLVRLRLTSGPS